MVLRNYRLYRAKSVKFEEISKFHGYLHHITSDAVILRALLDIKAANSGFANCNMPILAVEAANSGIDRYVVPILARTNANTGNESCIVPILAARGAKRNLQPC